MDRKLLRRHSTTTVIPNEINPISKWFAMNSFSVLCRELVLCATSSGNGVKIVCGRDAYNSDLYVYLNIEVVIVLVQ